MNSKSLEEAKSEFLQLIGSLSNASDIETFVTWIKNEAVDEILANNVDTDRSQKRRNLAQIAEFSKSLQPNFECILPSENITSPTNDREGLNFTNTAHIDAFLYDEADVEELTNAGKIPTHFCLNCGARKVKEIELITHSCGRDDLEFIFEALLPDLNGKLILDVGSRIGAVLFGAYIYTQNSKIVGIEMNPDLCNLAQNTIQRFNLQDRINVINAELSTRPDVISSADVIVLNNVFDWFVPIEVQVKLWQILRSHVKSGSLLVTIPSLEESLSKLPNHAEIDLNSWVKPSQPYRPSRLPSSEVEEKSETIRLYQVL